MASNFPQQRAVADLLASYDPTRPPYSGLSRGYFERHPSRYFTTFGSRAGGAWALFGVLALPAFFAAMCLTWMSTISLHVPTSDTLIPAAGALTVTIVGCFALLRLRYAFTSVRPSS